MNFSGWTLDNWILFIVHSWKVCGLSSLNLMLSSIKFQSYFAFLHVSWCEVIDTIYKANLRQFVVRLKKIRKLKIEKKNRLKRRKTISVKQNINILIWWEKVRLEFRADLAHDKKTCTLFLYSNVELTVFSWSLSNDSNGTPAADAILAKVFLNFRN